MWYLEGDFNHDGQASQQALYPLPMTIGREESLPCSILSNSVSRTHAEIVDGGLGILLIQDLDSSNGTFVNRRRIFTETELKHGDIIHLGTVELRLINRAQLAKTKPRTTSCANNTTVVSLGDNNLSENFLAGANELSQLLDQKQIQMAFQPVVRTRSKTTCGYEVLGRGTNQKLPNNPLALFKLAESLNQETILSRIFREAGVAEAARCQLKGMLLLKTHPHEMEDCDNLISSLQKLTKAFPNQLLMLEIPEQAVTDMSELNTLKHELTKLNIRLAFDDFGVGQSRLMELVTAQPHLIKFDKSLIQGLDQADSSRLALIMHIHEVLQELRIKTLAECVSNEKEHQSCQTIGFNLCQGFLFGHPTGGDSL